MEVLEETIQTVVRQQSLSFEEDISECVIEALGSDILQTLLADRTTGQNIFWGTSDYAHLGSGYDYVDYIKPELITGEHNDVIMPRVMKSQAQQTKRVKKMAEVFTPSWLCNKMNNGVDEAMFGRKPVFNTIPDNPTDHTWQPTEGKVEFPGARVKTWQEYVKSIVCEITCGEAPFLVSRYDAVTGQPFDDLRYRIGWIDRKLRIVNENTETKEDWLTWTREAFRAVIGYEWQGDNLLLARENMLITLFDYYQDRFHEQPPMDFVNEIAYIISWNFWQMDGLKFVVPLSCHTKVLETTDLMSGELIHKEIPCEGCKRDDVHKHNGIYCQVMDWEAGHPIPFVSLYKKK